MNTKTFIYWTLAIILLGLALTWSPSPATSSTESISLINHTEVAPNRMFRQGNEFVLDLHGLEQLPLQIETEGLTLQEQIIVSFPGLTLNPLIDISLQWTDINGTLHSQTIHQGGSNFTKIKLGETAVADLTLVFQPNKLMGHQPEFKPEVSFQQILLNPVSKTGQWQASLSHWFDFNPIQFASINSHIHQNDSHDLTLRLGSWLLVCLLLNGLFKLSKRHMLMVITLGWGLNTWPYVQNLVDQRQQLQQAFSHDQEHLNEIDLAMQEMATTVKTAFPDERLTVLGTAGFDRVRLMYHLSDQNAGLLTLSEALNQSADSLWLLTGRYFKYCAQDVLADPKIQAAELLMSNNSFCVLKP